MNDRDKQEKLLQETIVKARSIQITTEKELVKSVGELEEWLQEQSHRIATINILIIILSESVVIKKINDIDELWKYGYPAAIELGLDWDYVLNKTLKNVKSAKVDLKYQQNEASLKNTTLEEQLIKMMGELKTELQSIKKRQDIFFEKQMEMEKKVNETHERVNRVLNYNSLAPIVESGVQRAFGNHKLLPTFIEGSATILSELQEKIKVLEQVDSTTKQILNLQY